MLFPQVQSDPNTLFTSLLLSKCGHAGLQKTKMVAAILPDWRLPNGSQQTSTVPSQWFTLWFCRIMQYQYFVSAASNFSVSDVEPARFRSAKITFMRSTTMGDKNWLGLTSGLTVQDSRVLSHQTGKKLFIV